MKLIPLYFKIKNMCDYCPVVKIILNERGAILPSKGTELSIGYDLTAIAVRKTLTNRTTLYGTGLSVEPPCGYYIEILPRSSLSKTGYILANSVGIIDPDYNGELLIALTKVDDSTPELSLPFTRCQLVLRSAEYYKICETTKITSTERGSGGFGSTDSLV
jgi:dUTP pyrophosphatase